MAEIDRGIDPTELNVENNIGEPVAELPQAMRDQIDGMNIPDKEQVNKLTDKLALLNWPLILSKLRSDLDAHVQTLLRGNRVSLEYRMGRRGEDSDFATGLSHIKDELEEVGIILGSQRQEFPDKNGNPIIRFIVRIDADPKILSE